MHPVDLPQDVPAPTRFGWVPCLAVAALVLGGCTSTGSTSPAESVTSSSAVAPADAAPSGPLAAFYGQELDWAPCDGGECATVRVPLDYSAPEAATIDLALLRVKGSEAQGSLLVNPGGPGASGVDLARYAASFLTSDLMRAYDVIGFDPRGVGSSDPVSCASGSELDAFTSADWTPDTAQEAARISVTAMDLGVGCASASPDIAAHMATVDVARDMDVIRAALGEPSLNYLGFSYGTLLGAQYADLFPANVRRMVLDAVVPSALTMDQFNQQQADALDEALERFVADCLSLADCPLEGSVADGVARILTLLGDLDARPIPGAADRPLTESLATVALVASLFFPADGWPALRSGLTAALAGDGSELLALADSWNGRRPDGTYPDNYLQAAWAGTCSDYAAGGGPQHAAALAQGWVDSAPVFGRYQAWQTLPCWQWAPLQMPAPARSAAEATGSAPILVVSTTHDPGTPYEWGVHVAGELEKATLLTNDADGHTAYHPGSSCVQAAVDAYLIEGTLPADGTTCTPDP